MSKAIHLLGAAENGEIKLILIPISMLFVPTTEEQVVEQLKSMLSQAGLYDFSPGSNISQLISAFATTVVNTELKIANMLEQLASISATHVTEGILPTKKVSRESQKPW